MAHLPTVYIETTIPIYYLETRRTIQILAWREATFMSAFAAMLKAIHAQEDRESAEQKAALVVEKLETMRLSRAAAIVREGVSETLSYMNFPREHRRCIKTNNPLERLNREVRRRTRVVGAFPDGQSALMLVAARLRHVAGTKWGTRRYLDMTRLREPELTEQTLTAAA